MAMLTGFVEVRAPCPLPRITQIYYTGIGECKSDLLMFRIGRTLFGVGGILVKKVEGYRLKSDVRRNMK